MKTNQHHQQQHFVTADNQRQHPYYSNEMTASNQLVISKDSTVVNLEYLNFSNTYTSSSSNNANNHTAQSYYEDQSGKGFYSVDQVDYSAYHQSQYKSNWHQYSNSTNSTSNIPYYTNYYEPGNNHEHRQQQEVAQVNPNFTSQQQLYQQHQQVGSQECCHYEVNHRLNFNYPTSQVEHSAYFNDSNHDERALSSEYTQVAGVANVVPPVQTTQSIWCSKTADILNYSSQAPTKPQLEQQNLYWTQVPQNVVEQQQLAEQTNNNSILQGKQQCQKLTIKRAKSNKLSSPTLINSNSAANKQAFNNEDLNQQRQRTNQCNVCGRLYARPSTLKTHLRTHTNERPFKCNVCNKTFSQAANLTAHQRVHTGK